MHYYKKNIGDYAKKAGRLSMLQHGAYTLLMDSCYDREQFPTEGDAIDWCWASTDAEISAVKFVLGRFFSLEDGVYIQNRVKEEIDKYHENSAINKRIAEERETKRRDLRTKRATKDTKRKGSVDEATPNQEPLTINQEPIKNMILPDWIDQGLWDGFIEIRKRQKATNSKRAINIIIKKLRNFKSDGIDPNIVLENSIENSWKGVFPPKQQVGGNGKFNLSEALKNDMQRITEREMDNSPICALESDLHGQVG